MDIIKCINKKKENNVTFNQRIIITNEQSLIHVCVCMCESVYIWDMPRNNVSHQCYISCNISLFFNLSNYYVYISCVHVPSFLLFCFVFVVPRAYETLIWYIAYCFILRRKDAQLWRKLNAAKDERRERKPRMNERKMDRRKPTLS